MRNLLPSSVPSGTLPKIIPLPYPSNPILFTTALLDTVPLETLKAAKYNTNKTTQNNRIWEAEGCKTNCNVWNNTWCFLYQYEPYCYLILGPATLEKYLDLQSFATETACTSKKNHALMKGDRNWTYTLPHLRSSKWLRAIGDNDTDPEKTIRKTPSSIRSLSTSLPSDIFLYHNLRPL